MRPNVVYENLACIINNSWAWYKIHLLLSHNNPSLLNAKYHFWICFYPQFFSIFSHVNLNQTGNFYCTFQLRLINYHRIPILFTLRKLKLWQAELFLLLSNVHDHMYVVCKIMFSKEVQTYYYFVIIYFTFIASP